MMSGQDQTHQKDFFFLSNNPFRSVTAARRVHFITLASFIAFMVIANCRMLHFSAIEDTPAMVYNRTAIFYSYFDTGFFRRGLSGTILHIFGDPSKLNSLLYFHIFSSIWLAVPTSLMIRGLYIKQGAHAALFYLAVLIIAPFAFRGWASDVGRADMLGLGFIAWSVLALLHDRPSVAAVLIATGALCHETCAIMGVPLLTVLGVALAQQKPEMTKRLGFAAIIMVSLILLYLLASVYAADPKALLNPARNFYQKILPLMQDGISRFLLEAGLFNLLQATRSLRSSICVNFINDHYLWNVTMIIIMLLISLYILGIKSRNAIAAALLASIAPTIILSLIGIDLGRWLRMGFFNAWLLAAGLLLINQWQITSTRNLYLPRIAICALLSFAGNRTFSLSYSSIFTAGYWSDIVVNAIKGPQMRDMKGLMEICDSSIISDIRKELSTTAEAP